MSAIIARFDGLLSALLPSLPEDDPYVAAMQAARTEFVMGGRAVLNGNAGQVRVCARRAVGTFIQGIAAVTGPDYGSHAMANLRSLRDDQHLPDAVRAAAERLLGGTRGNAANQPHSLDPLDDALTIISSFISAAFTRS